MIESVKEIKREISNRMENGGDLHMEILLGNLEKQMPDLPRDYLIAQLVELVAESAAMNAQYDSGYLEQIFNIDISIAQRIKRTIHGHLDCMKRTIKNKDAELSIRKNELLEKMTPDISEEKEQQLTQAVLGIRSKLEHIEEVKKSCSALESEIEQRLEDSCQMMSDIMKRFSFVKTHQKTFIFDEGVLTWEVPKNLNNGDILNSDTLELLGFDTKELKREIEKLLHIGKYLSKWASEKAPRSLVSKGTKSNSLIFFNNNNTREIKDYVLSNIDNLKRLAG